MKHVDYYAKTLAEKLKDPGIIVDATAGNGQDTLWLALQFPKAQIFAFDIQKKALDRTGALLVENNLSNVELILDSHVNIPTHVQGTIDLLVFNLGYLPGSDKKRHTKPHTTIRAIDNSRDHLAKGGLIMITAYPGSIRGEIEAIALEHHLSNFSQSTWDIAKIQMVNQRNKPPVLYIIHKK